MSLFKKMAADIGRHISNVANALSTFSYDYTTTQYTEECPKSWPLKDGEGNEILDPVTGTKFGDEESPEKLAHLVKERDEKVTHDGITYTAKVVVWVDATGRPNDEKIVRAGRMIELYGCKPWTKLKALLRNRDELSSIIKNADT
jgi:hypothetical protein